MLFIAKDGLAYSSMKVYLSAVRSLHVSVGLHDDFTKQLTPCLKLVVAGIKKEDARNGEKIAETANN